MDSALLKDALIKFFAGFSVICLLLFIPAGTLNFWNAWLLILLLFVPMFAAGIIMLFKNPELLRKRLKNKEIQTEQKFVILGSLIMFLTGFILAGLNFRFKWHILPNYIIIISSIIFIFSYILYAEVLRENVFLSRIIEVQENQKVIDSGLYGIVRHPMYSATIFLFLSMPLILGSIFSFIIFLTYIPLIAKRIKNEEIFLEKNLEGYSDYKNKVKYKVIPFIW